MKSALRFRKGSWNPQAFPYLMRKSRCTPNILSEFADFLRGLWNDADRPVASDPFDAAGIFAVPCASVEMSFDEYAAAEWRLGLADGDVGFPFAAGVSALCLGDR